MKIINVETATASNNNPYKKVTIETKIFGDKDRFNIFNNHSKYDKCVEGVDIPQDLLFINDRGYLDLKDPDPKPKGTAKIDSGKIDQIYSMVHAIHKEIVVPKIGNTDVDYPTGKETGADEGTTFDGPVAGTNSDINPEDIPF